MPHNNVVITGVGVVSSIGIGGDAFFDSLMEKRSGIQSLAARSDEGAKPGVVKEPAGLWIGGPIVDFDAKPYIRPRKAIKVMCREIQTAYAASHLALVDAGLDDLLPCDPNGPIKPESVGTVFGSEMMYGPPQEMVDPVTACFDDDGTLHTERFGHAAMKGIMPLWMLKYLPNMPACHVGIAVNAHGPNNTLVVGDVSGPAAIIESASCIDRSIAKVMISGATGTRINTTRLNYSGDLPFADVADPVQNSSRPHDPDSTGVVGGEAAAAVVLERADEANDRGGRPLALLSGYASRFIAAPGIRNGHRTDSIVNPYQRGSSDAIALAIEAAMKQARCTADDVGMVVSHGMGDPSMDAAERDALQRFLPGVPVVAPIASIGHTGAASGTIAIATAALSLARGAVPPTLNAELSHRDVHLLSQPQPLDGPAVVCLSHTSEGIATVIVLRKPASAE